MREMKVLRLKSTGGIIKAEYSEMEKPVDKKYIDTTSEFAELAFQKIEQFNSSFKPLQLSDKATELIKELMPLGYEYVETFLELTGKEIEQFEIKDNVLCLKDVDESQDELIITDDDLSKKSEEIQKYFHKMIDSLRMQSSISYESAFATVLYLKLAEIELKIERIKK